MKETLNTEGISNFAAEGQSDSTDISGWCTVICQWHLKYSILNILNIEYRIRKEFKKSNFAAEGQSECTDISGSCTFQLAVICQWHLADSFSSLAVNYIKKNIKVKSTVSGEIIFVMEECRNCVFYELENCTKLSENLP